MLIYAKITGSFEVELVKKKVDDGSIYKEFDVTGLKPFNVKVSYDKTTEVFLSTKKQTVDYYMVGGNEFLHTSDNFCYVIENSVIKKGNYIETMSVDKGSNLTRKNIKAFDFKAALPVYIDYIRKSTDTMFTTEITGEVDEGKAIDYRYVVEYYRKTKKTDEASVESLVFFNNSMASKGIVKDILAYLKNLDESKNIVKNVLLSGDITCETFENLPEKEMNILSSIYGITNLKANEKCEKLMSIINGMKKERVVLPEIQRVSLAVPGGNLPVKRGRAGTLALGRTTTVSLPRSRAGTVSTSRSRAGTLTEGKKMTIEDFLEYTLDDLVNCTEREVFIEELKLSGYTHIYKGKFKTNSKCNVIKSGECPITAKYDCKEYKTIIAVKVINMFIDEGFMSKKGNYYYILDTNKRLTWYNLKYLTKKDVASFNKVSKLAYIFTGGYKDLSVDEILMFVKCLFWLFRKAVVDSIVSDMINKVENKMGERVEAMSVGSTRLTSDYDVTLGGSYKANAFIISKYEMIIKLLLKVGSDEVFDTNVYGASFISSNKDELFGDKHSLCSGDFYYIKQTQLFDTSQHIWAFVKLSMKLETIAHHDDKLFSKLNDEIEGKLGEHPFYAVSRSFVNKYESSIEHYKDTVKWSSQYYELNKELADKSYLLGNFISFVNYNGSETYLTNGAFLDVVVNAQICKRDNSKIIKLSMDQYFDSFVENASDLMTHFHKTKYLERCILAVGNILGKNLVGASMQDKLAELSSTDEDIRIIIEKLKVINDIQARCSSDISECLTNKIVISCLDCIIRITMWLTRSKQMTTLNTDSEVFDRILFTEFGDEYIDKSVVDALAED